MSCPICRSDATAPDGLLGEIGFDRCSGCDFVFARDAAARARVYAEDEYGVRDVYHGDLDAAWGVNSRVRVAYVRARRGSGRLLDIGSGGGHFVAVAAKEGFDASGVESTPSFARHAREDLGIEVIEQPIEELDLPSGAYDVITMWHVLEHIPDPVETLRRLRPALADGGLIVIEVPNSESVIARMLGEAWPQLDAEVHVNQFSATTLRRALQAAGFVDIELETVSHLSYLTKRQQLSPRAIVHRLQIARRERRDPLRHEFLRATAVPAASAIAAA